MVAAAPGPAGTTRRRPRPNSSRYAVDAVEWQTWANPEFMQFDTGLRLDELDPEVRETVLALVAATLSPGRLRAGPQPDADQRLPRRGRRPAELLNEFSYNIALYGEPDLRAPWGWQLFGHHCAVNCLVVEGRHGGLAGLPRRRTRRDRRRPARRACATFSPTGSPRRRLMAALPEDQRGTRPRLRADGRPGHAARAGCTPATSGTWPARSRTTA